MDRDTVPPPAGGGGGGGGVGGGGGAVTATATVAAGARPPPRRRHRGRRGGGGGGGGGTGASGTTNSDGSARKRGPRKSRRGGGGGGGAAATAAANAANASGDSNIRGESFQQLQQRAEVKVVVRRLPPRMSASEFFSDAENRGASNAVWRSFHAGAVSGGKRAGELFIRHSTAYLAFARGADAAAFFHAQNGTRYMDKGVEYVARVERAMFQVVPRFVSKRPSALHGTIENDAHFKRFLDTLKDEAVATNHGPIPPKPKVRGPPPVNVTKTMEEVRARRKIRDHRKGPKTASAGRAARRRGRRAAAAAAAAAASVTSTTTTATNSTAGTLPGGGKPILLKKPPVGSDFEPTRDKPPKKGGRGSRAAKRAAAAAAAAATSEAGGTSVTQAEGDGVYVVRVSRPSRDSLLQKQLPLSAMSTSRTSNRAQDSGSPSRGTPRRKGKGPRTPTMPVGSPGRPAVRLLKKAPNGNDEQQAGT